MMGWTYSSNGGKQKCDGENLWKPSIRKVKEKTVW
jgi:hypothetical protein